MSHATENMSINKIVYPGEIITNIKSTKNVTVLGLGLRPNENPPNTLQVTRPGVLHFKSPNTYWIESRQQRYIPKKGDLVVGIVAKKSGDNLKIDIGSSEYASLSLFAFEGATKKQKPDLQIGDMIYGKLLNAYREMEPELICVDAYFKAGRLGALPNEGHLVEYPCDFAQRLLDIENPLLRTLGKRFVYEIAVGVNGKIWIRAKTINDTMRIIRTLEAAENCTNDKIITLCKQLKF